MYFLEQCYHYAYVLVERRLKYSTNIYLLQSLVEAYLISLNHCLYALHLARYTVRRINLLVAFPQLLQSRWNVSRDSP